MARVQRSRAGSYSSSRSSVRTGGSSGKSSSSRSSSSVASSSKKTAGKTANTVIRSRSSNKSNHTSKSGSVNRDKVTISKKVSNNASKSSNANSESVSSVTVTKNSDRFEKSKRTKTHHETVDNVTDLVKSKIKKGLTSGKLQNSDTSNKNSNNSEKLNEYRQQYELDRIKKNNEKAIEKETIEIIKRDAEMLTGIVGQQINFPKSEMVSTFKRKLEEAGKIKNKTIKKKQIKKIIKNFVEDYGNDVNIKKYIDKRLLPPSLSKVLIGDDKNKRELKKWEIYELAKDKANTIEYAGALGTALAIGFAPNIIGKAAGKLGGSLAASKSLATVLKGESILSQKKVEEIVRKEIVKKAAENLVAIGSGTSMLKITGESLKRAIEQINQQAIKKVKPGNVSTPWYTTYRKNIELSPKQMYLLGKHFNKHGREMGYHSKKEYDAAARAFVERNKDTATMYEGRWTDSSGKESQQRQIIIQAEGCQAVINRKTMQLIDFFDGNSLRGFYDIRSIPVK